MDEWTALNTAMTEAATQMQSVSGEAIPEYLKTTLLAFVKVILDRAQEHGLPKKWVPDLALALGFSLSFGAFFAGNGTITSAFVYGLTIGLGAIGYNSYSKHRNGASS